ncbi:hypothetical protein [Gaoshiqia sp. Z1-71]|uniref:hypothetical protein n=1 Tax=Gaoshiqia hydrogeniformans TaxID=3290090 RepID=UPI003BF8713F
MKAWSFEVKSNPKEISQKLESTFKDVNGFALNLNRDKNDFVTFKIHKRALELFQIYLLNNIIVNGKIIKTNVENETKVEISFAQHLMMKLTMFVNILFGIGLIALLIMKSNISYIFILGGILLIIGILIWLDMKKRFNRNVQDYKNLISEMLQI